VLLAGVVPYMDLLLAQLVDTDRLSATLGESIDALDQLGIRAGVAFHGLGDAPTTIEDSLPGSALYSLDAGTASRLREAGEEATWIEDVLVDRADDLGVSLTGLAASGYEDAPARQWIPRLGGEFHTLDSPAPTANVTVSVTPHENHSALARLEKAAAAGAEVLISSSPQELIEHLLTTRTGAWRKTNLQPVLGSTLLSRARITSRGKTAS
jgi:hypothetical protein